MKKILIFTAGLLLSAGAVLVFAHNKPLTAEESLLLKNIEALSQNEGGNSGGQCGFAAYEYDGDWYEDSKEFRRCGDCQWVKGTQPRYTQC